MKTLTICLFTLLIAGCSGGSSSGPSSSLNVAPTIANIIDITATVNQIVETQIRVSDDLTPASELTVVVTTANSTVVDTVRVNDNSSVIIEPVIDAAGVATLTVVVSDQAGLTAETSFSVAFERGNIQFDQILQSVLDRPKDSLPVTINEFAISPVETSFNIAEIAPDD